MTLTVIDTFGFLFRNYYALPPLKSKSGFPTGMITGFMNFITSLGRDFKTDYILFSIDSKTKTFRKDIFPAYKANRPEAPEDLKVQLPVAIELIEKMGFTNISIDGYESDDIIASIAKIAVDHGIKVQIVSHDKDMYQLINDDKVVIIDPIKKIEINEKAAFEKFGVHPKDFIHFQSLVGDSSDNVPGVKGVGIKTAAKLINEFQTLDNLYENIGEIKGAMQKKLIEGKESAYISKELVTLHPDLFDSFDLEQFCFPEINPVLKITNELIDLGITSVLERVEKKGLFVKTKEPKVEFESILLDTKEKLFDVITSISEGSVVAFDTETTSLERDKKIVGFSFCVGEERGYYVPINHNYLGVSDQVSQEDALEAIQKLFSFKVVGHNLKFDLGLTYSYGVSKISPFMDTMLLAWILSPDENVGLDKLAKRYFNYEMISFKETVKKGENFSSVTLEDACNYAAEDAVITFKLYHFLKDKLSWDIEGEIKEVEIPFIDILHKMEKRGIKVDVSYFQKMKEEIGEKLSTLTEEIYKEAGSEFNINSTKQLGGILFETLGLPPVKKTKTGYSTNEAVLSTLKDEHAIIPKLLDYRELFKLQSTYVEPLIKYALADKEAKVYSSFLQTGTATGRLSSKDPNLQNIPVNKEFNIRNGFISEKLFVSMDYSQIELRLLAHFSKDPVLIEAFKADRDIHMETSQKIFPENAEKMRGVAKSINFGLIYGMGARKLAETIKVSNKEAKAFIGKYFESFPTVKSFLNSQKELVHERGYVETLLKRRRFFDFASVNAFMASNFEREAVNTVFQGSAADIIKLAMLDMDKKGADIVLQIHDELIIEVGSEEEAYDFKEIMENVVQLEIPLKVGLSSAKRWGELK